MLTAVGRIQRFCQLSSAYLQKNNPILMFFNTIVVQWTELVSSNKKLKVVKYRVNHLKYRLYQMEQVIEHGNPYNLAEGKRMDRLQ